MNGLADCEWHRARMMELLGARAAASGGVLQVAHPSLAWPWVNYACPLDAGPAGVGAPAAGLAAAEAALAAAMAGQQAAGRIPCVLLAGPGRADWADWLARRPGDSPPACRERQQVLVLERGSFTPGAAPPANPPGVRVWPVPAGAERAWAELMLTAFGLPAELQPGLAAAWAGAGEQARARNAGSVRLYLAAAGHQPVGTGLLYLDTDGTAGLYGGAVLPDWRGRGIGRALTIRRLTDAFAAGAVRAVVQTSAPAVAALWYGMGAPEAYLAELWY